MIMPRSCAPCSGAISKPEASSASSNPSTPRVCGFRFASMARAARPAAVCSAGGTSTKLLSNPTYVGRIAHKGQVHEGQHPPLVDQDLWDRVQQSLREHLGSARTKRTRQSSEALLAGKLFDDRGNRMSPTWA